MKKCLPTNWVIRMKWTNFQKKKVLKLMPEETENLNRLITTKEIGLIINKLSQRMARPQRFTGIFQETFNTHVLQNFTKKQKKREHFPIHSMRPALPQYQNQTKTVQQNYRPVPFMNIEVKIFKTNTSKLNPATYKKDYIPYQGGLIPEMQG